MAAPLLTWYFPQTLGCPAVQVDVTQRQSVLHEEARELLRVLSRYRWRLGFERTLRFGLRGAVGSGLALILLSIAAWLAGLPDANWLAAVPLAIGVGVAVVRWPSHAQAALAADRRLGLEERLATALELARRRGIGRFDALQVRDAVAQAASAGSGWLTLDHRIRREAWLACGVLVMAASSSLLLGRLPPPVRQGIDETAASFSEGTTPIDLSRRALPLDEADIAPASAQPVPQAQPDVGLAARVQQEQNERNALDGLSRALSSVSAGQPAATDIQQGDFSAARKELQALADDADQLSDAAKQQLSRALQDAASATAQADRQLADRERQAAQALNRATYGEQRQALRGLGDQLERSGSRSVSADQLARDVGQLQQQASKSPGSSPRAEAPSPGQPNAGGPGTELAQQPGGPAGGEGSGLSGQQGGPGVGKGRDPILLGEQPSRLDTAGERVQVPTRLSSGEPGVRPADGTEDQIGADPSALGQSVFEATQAQQTGQVAPEQNLVPGERRPVIRGYFR